MHDMLSLTIISLLGFAASSQAHPLQTSNANLFRRANYPRPLCNAANPIPQGSTCGKTGKISNPSYYGGATSGPFFINLGEGAAANLNACQALCQQIQTCKSMSWDPTSHQCSLYTMKVTAQSFVAGGGTLRFYDKNCYACTDATCLPTLVNTGFELSSNGHYGPWQADAESAPNVGVASTGFAGGDNSLSLTAKPGQHVSVHQPFTWCADQSTSYQISFNYKFLQNIPGSGMDVDYSGLLGSHGGPPTSTTFFDAVNPGNSDWQQATAIVTPQYTGDITFYVYSNPFYAESQTVLIDNIVIRQQT